KPLYVKFSCKATALLRTFALIGFKNPRSSGNFDYEYRFLQSQPKIQIGIQTSGKPPKQVP
ncbi:hypothetical protein, partial [Neglectibacter sp. 59]|uniref:hypothetical protein n=1 Tax=Neglectibacter sp. 59 TaxID=2304573 RepID=UPI001A9C2624